MTGIVIGFSGKIASGKSSISEVTADALNLPRVGFGDYVRHVVDYMGLDPTDRELLQQQGHLLAKYPKPFCAKVLAQSNYQPGQPLVIDGIRHKHILDELRSQVEPAKLMLVYVNTEDSTIESRLRQQGYSHSRIETMEQDPTENQVPNVLRKLADLEVDNSQPRSPEQIRNEFVPKIKDCLENVVNRPDWINGRSGPRPVFGGSKGLFQMSDDFDEPLNDFAEYM